MELYNFQQQLAKMQMQLEKSQENYAHISQIRREAEEQLRRLQSTHSEEEQLTAQERLKVWAHLECSQKWVTLEANSLRNHSELLTASRSFIPVKHHALCTSAAQCPLVNMQCLPCTLSTSNAFILHLMSC